MTVRVLVILGVRSPTMALARRFHQLGIKVYLIDFVPNEQKHPFLVKPTSAAEGLPELLSWTLVGTEEGFQQILRFLVHVGADALITVDEFAQLWMAGRRKELPMQCRLLSPNQEQLLGLLDKWHQIASARECGLQVLPTWEIQTVVDAAKIPDAEFPVCVRPTHVNSIQPFLKAAVYPSRQVLETELARYQWTHPLAVQPFRYGPNYVLHAVRSLSGEMLAMRLFRAERKSEGFASTIVEAELPAMLAQAVQRFAQAEQIVGPFHFDLLQPEGSAEFFFLEVNVRFGGTTAKVTRLGMDEPTLVLRAFGLQPPLDPPLARSAKRVTTLSLELRRAWNELTGKSDPLAYPRFSGFRGLVTALLQILLIPDAILTWSDIRGSIWYTIHGNR